MRKSTHQMDLLCRSSKGTAAVRVVGDGCWLGNDSEVMKDNISHYCRRTWLSEM